MTAYASDTLQPAVLAALNGDSALSAAVQGIYDEPPASPTPPYVSLGETREEMWDTKTEGGASVTFDIDVISDAPGQLQAKQISALVDAVMQPAGFTVTGFTLVSLRLVTAIVTRITDQAATSHRSRMTYRALLRKQ